MDFDDFLENAQFMRRMDMTTNEEKLKESLETRRPVLFLGAGFPWKQIAEVVAL